MARKIDFRHRTGLALFTVLSLLFAMAAANCPARHSSLLLLSLLFGVIVLWGIGDLFDELASQEGIAHSKGYHRFVLFACGFVVLYFFRVAFFPQPPPPEKARDKARAILKRLSDVEIEAMMYEIREMQE